MSWTIQNRYLYGFYLILLRPRFSLCGKSKQKPGSRNLPHGMAPSYKAQPSPFGRLLVTFFMASSSAWVQGFAALRPLGLRQFTLRCPSLLPTGAAPLVQCPDEIVANHTTNEHHVERTAIPASGDQSSRGEHLSPSCFLAGPWT